MERPAWLGWVFWALAALCFAIAAFGSVLGITAGANVIAMGLLFMTLSLRT